MTRIALCVTAVFAFLAPTTGAIAQTRTSVQSTGERELPWTVVIRPSAKAVAIGNCQAVYIELTDETGKDTPRQPGGFRVSISDFDWSASGERPT
ncbi:MAG: hypothetical protein JWO39_682, partial [Gemmatimonadetes bacterium]|nr:hypothetical protein [Gemmatimonadota bacterium]